MRAGIRLFLIAIWMCVSLPNAWAQDTPAYYGQAAPDLGAIVRQEIHGPEKNIFDAIHEAYQRERERGRFIEHDGPLHDNWSDPDLPENMDKEIEDRPLEPGEISDEDSLDHDGLPSPDAYDGAPDHDDVDSELPSELPDKDSGDDDSSDSDGSWDGGWDDVGDDDTSWASAPTSRRDSAPCIMASFANHPTALIAGALPRHP